MDRAFTKLAGGIAQVKEYIAAGAMSRLQHQGALEKAGTFPATPATGGLALLRYKGRAGLNIACWPPTVA